MKTVQILIAVCCLSVVALSGCGNKACSTYTDATTCGANSYNSTTCVWTAPVCPTTCTLDTTKNFCCTGTGTACTSTDTGCTATTAGTCG